MSDFFINFCAGEFDEITIRETKIGIYLEGKLTGGCIARGKNEFELNFQNLL
jgi:hypothetical protein